MLNALKDTVPGMELHRRHGVSDSPQRRRLDRSDPLSRAERPRADPGARTA